MKRSFRVSSVKTNRSQKRITRSRGMALYREFHSIIKKTVRKCAEIYRAARRDFLMPRGTEVRDDAPSFCPFARMRIARSAKARHFDLQFIRRLIN